MVFSTKKNILLTINNFYNDLRNSLQLFRETDSVGLQHINENPIQFISVIAHRQICSIWHHTHTISCCCCFHELLPVDYRGCKILSIVLK